MISFMVIGEPRSGTTWAANWLTTDTTLCLHDPLTTLHYSNWDQIESKKILGISDTGISKFDYWLNDHSAKKVILHRNREEIAMSLGMPEFLDVPSNLDLIDGMHCHWEELFDNPKPIYEYLLDKEFDAERHAELCKIRMAPLEEKMTFNRQVMDRLITEIRGSNHA
jgi:hypothetical protein